MARAPLRSSLPRARRGSPGTPLGILSGQWGYAWGLACLYSLSGRLREATASLMVGIVPLVENDLVAT